MSAYKVVAKHIKGIVPATVPARGVSSLAVLLGVLALLAMLAWQSPALASGAKDGAQAGLQASDGKNPAKSTPSGAAGAEGAKPLPDAKDAQTSAKADGKDRKDASDPAGGEAREGAKQETPSKEASGKETPGKADAGQAGEAPKEQAGAGGGNKDGSSGKGDGDKPSKKDGGDKPDKKDGKGSKPGTKDRKDAKENEGGTAGDGYSKKQLWPPVGALITSPYGAIRGTYRVFGSSGVRRHGGVDFRAHLGWPVTALRDGTVLQAGPRGAAGIAVDLKMKDGRRALYFHLSKVLVKPGETVSRGQHLGLVGCTGRTTGAHLHFAMKDERGATIDPTPHIQGLWELFDPPASDLQGTIQPQSCDGHRHPGGYPWAGRNYRSGWRGKPWRGRHYGPLLDGSYFYLGNSIFGRHAPPAIRGNRRLRGNQQYLRMRRALQDSSHYHIQDPIPSWESQHRKP